MSARDLLVVRLGTVPYADALALQRAVARGRIDGTIAHDVLLTLEHPPVVTLGRSAKPGHLLAARDVLAARGVEVHEVERGGDVTFHGPGQLVAYPILALREHREDVHWYLRRLEEVLIATLASVGVAAERRDGLTGVWTNGRKIASIGVHAKQWVTWHGVALNVTTDLSYFDAIVACGIEGVQMTSVAQEQSRATAGADPAALRATVERGFVDAFAQVFALRPVDTPATALQSAGPVTR